jgi:hypothetical protein
MSTTVQIEHAVTIMEAKLCVFESDVVVTASVHDDGEVIISNVEMTGVVPRVRSIESFALDHVKVPMTDSSNPHMVRLGNWAMEILLDDEGFIAKARHEAGVVYVGMGGNDPDGGFKRVRGYA